MKVNLHTILAGPDGGFSPGLADLPEEMAKDLIKGGFAEAAEDFVETASVEPPEKAIKQKAQPRKRGNKK